MVQIRPFSCLILALDSSKLIAMVFILAVNFEFSIYVESTTFSRFEILVSYPFTSTSIGSCPNTIQATNPPRIANIK